MNRKLKKVKIRTDATADGGSAKWERGQGSLEILREFLHRQGLAQGRREGGDGGQGLTVGGGGFGGATRGGEDIASTAKQALATRRFLQGVFDATQGGGGIASSEIEGDGLLDEREGRAHASQPGFEGGERGGPVNGGEELGVPQVVIGSGHGGEADAFAIVAGGYLELAKAGGDLGAKKLALGVGRCSGEIGGEMREGLLRCASFVLHPRSQQGYHRALGLELGRGDEVGFGFVPFLMMAVKLSAADIEVGLGGACDLLGERVEERLVGAMRGEVWRQCENRGGEGEGKCPEKNHARPKR